MSNLSSYKDKLALVARVGDGIGEMLAKGFAGAGLRVCVQDIREDAAARMTGEIGDAAFPLVFDVSDRGATMAAAEAQDVSVNVTKVTRDLDETTQKTVNNLVKAAGELSGNPSTMGDEVETFMKRLSA